MPKKIGEYQWEALLEKIRNNDSTLISLDFSQEKILDVGPLAKALRSNTTVIALDLSENEIDNEDAIELGKMLKENKTLRILNLRDNKIGPRGCQALGQALQENSTLTDLSLRRNKVGDAGCVMLVESPRYLLSLDLSSNVISDKGAEALAKIVQQNAPLTWLNLEDNEITDQGGLQLAQALAVNRSLMLLELRNNHIYEPAIEKFTAALQQNKTLLSLRLRISRVSRASFKGTSGSDGYDGLMRNQKLCDQLHEAVANHDIANVERLLKEGVSLLATIGDKDESRDFNTPLHRAVMKNDVELATILIKEMQRRNISLLSENKENKTAQDLVTTPAMQALFQSAFVQAAPNANPSQEQWLQFQKIEKELAESQKRLTESQRKILETEKKLIAAEQRITQQNQRIAELEKQLQPKVLPPSLAAAMVAQSSPIFASENAEKTTQQLKNNLKSVLDSRLPFVANTVLAEKKLEIYLREKNHPYASKFLQRIAERLLEKLGNNVIVHHEIIGNTLCLKVKTTLQVQSLEKYLHAIGLFEQPSKESHIVNSMKN